MKSIRFILVGLMVCAPAFGASDARKAGENAKAVLPPQRRAEALRKADDMLAVVASDSETLTAELSDPFYPSIKRVRKAGVPDAAPVIADDYLLARAADSIKPQGTMLIGNEPYLLLDGRRYKSGDAIPVNVDGVGVQITVSSIQRNSYTLRLKDQELRREFK